MAPRNYRKYFISIPLKNNMSATALVARHASTLLCLHAFAEASVDIPDQKRLDRLNPTDVYCVTRVWDTKLKSGLWDVIGHSALPDDEFDRMWGVPCFGAVDLISFQFHKRIEYGADLMTRTEHPCSMREALRLDRDCISGTGALVIGLESALVDQEFADEFLVHRVARERGIHHLRNIGHEVE